MAPMNGLLLATIGFRGFRAIYYCTVKEGKFTDGHFNLKNALTCKEDWEPDLKWKFTNIAPSSLIDWSDK